MSDTQDCPLVPGEDSVARFISGVNGAAEFLKIAHCYHKVRLSRLGGHSRQNLELDPVRWQTHMVKDASAKADQITFIMVTYPASGAAVEPEVCAFRILAELTPVGPNLRILYERNRHQAYAELRKHVHLLAMQVEAATKLAEQVADTKSSADASPPDAFAWVSTELLERTGGGLTLTDAANLLGLTRQAMHKKIHAGNALGMMSDRNIIVPRVQFRNENGNWSVLPGIDKVTRLFNEAEAGGWAELQFLAEIDPNLACAPIDALRDGKVDDVVHAAKAHLGLDEN